MKCYAEQQNLTRLDRGTSGAIPICVATLSGFFVGDEPVKTCTKCNQTKLLSEFYIDRAKKDGHRPDCKICNLKHLNKYRKTERGKIVIRHSMNIYNHSERGRFARKCYSQTEKGKVAQKASHKRTYLRYPEHLKAKNAVNNAVIAGRLPNINIRQCYYCSTKAQQYHHYLGYEQKNWLKVRPACRKCHRKIHKIGA